jgi:hypothetical protein
MIYQSFTKYSDAPACRNALRMPDTRLTATPPRLTSQVSRQPSALETACQTWLRLGNISSGLTTLAYTSHPRDLICAVLSSCGHSCQS